MVNYTFIRTVLYRCLFSLLFFSFDFPNLHLFQEFRNLLTICLKNYIISFVENIFSSYYKAISNQIFSFYLQIELLEYFICYN